MRTLLKTACLGGLLLSVAPIVRAQDMPPVMDWLTPTIESQRFGDLLRANLGESNYNSDRPKVRKQGITPSSTRQVSFAYSPTSALKQKTVQGYIDRLRTKNPAASQALKDNFGSGKYDYGQIYWGLVKESGLRENDAADAMSAYLIVGYAIVNNLDGKAISVPMAQSVRSQVASLLKANSRLTAPGIPAQLGEELKLQTVIVQGGWQSAIKENNLPNYQRAIAAMFKNQYGLNLSQVKLTNQGFVKK